MPPTYIDLQPCDVVTINLPYASFELIILQISYTAGGVLDIQATLNDAAAYAPNSVGGQGSLSSGLIGFAGDSQMALLDIPLIRDTDDSYGFPAALCGFAPSWTGGTIVRSNDNEQTWTPIQGFADSVTICQALNSLGQDDGYVIDRINTLTVQPFSSEMTFVSISEAQLLTGKHWCAYGADGRWELIRFANATLNADGSYTLDTLIRGARGTEQHTGSHADYDLLVFLDDSNLGTIGLSVEDVRVARKWRGITREQSIDAVASVDFIYNANNLKPLSPIYPASNKNGANDINVFYKRRSRLATSWWLSGVQRPLGEASESYEIDIIDTAGARLPHHPARALILLTSKSVILAAFSPP